MHALRGLLTKEIRHVARDRRTLTVILMLPVVQVILFGFAIRTDVQNIRLAFVDPAPDATTQAVQTRFVATDAFKVVATLRSPRTLSELFAKGEVQQAIIFEPDFSVHLGRGEPARVQIITDVAEPNTGGAMHSYALAVLQTHERELRQHTRATTIIPETRMRFNPTRESSNLFVPGLMAMVLTIISSLMTAISLTREKETGTMEVLLVSPLRPPEIIAGKVLPYLGIGFASLLLILVEARLIFDVPMRGSVTLLLAEGLLYILTSLSLGILISTRTSSQRVAMTGALAGTLLPNVMLSGFIFPIESMPAALRMISQIIPARWFVEITRGVMLKGVGLDVLWQETAILIGMTALLLLASVRSFNTRLE